MPHPETGEILWFNPDPRAVIPLDGFHMSRSLRRSIAKRGYTVTSDRAFVDVMKGCADRKETWINDTFFRAYSELHRMGFAHSIEVWLGDELVGGCYGVHICGIFCAESMFSRKTDASKVALKYLVGHLKERGIDLLEVQFLTPHLASLGAIEISAGAYHKLLREALMKDAVWV
jgi:leucyl/phenylalanyl-tRNA--protein transferase